MSLQRQLQRSSKANRSQSSTCPIKFSVQSHYEVQSKIMQLLLRRNVGGRRYALPIMCFFIWTQHKWSFNKSSTCTARHWRRGDTIFRSVGNYLPTAQSNIWEDLNLHHNMWEIQSRNALTSAAYWIVVQGIVYTTKTLQYGLMLSTV
jgi:DNA-binding transcriptional regulator LsrR (DeoR family)